MVNIFEEIGLTRKIIFILLFLLWSLLLFGLRHSTVHCQGTRFTKRISYSTTVPESPSLPLTNRVKGGNWDGVRKIILSIVLGVICGLMGSIVFALVVRVFVRYLSRTPILKGPVIFSPKIDPKALQRAALENDTDSPFRGSSLMGKYYRTVLNNGVTVVVKKLNPFTHAWPESGRSKSLKRRMQQELELLASLKHRHLMSLMAYVRDADRLSLVYDYVHTGSLEDVMVRVREDNQGLSLGWEIRLRIAVGIVKGLQFLHFECVPQILHYNLKPSNVMLDAEFEPILTDCGLAKLLPPNFDRGVSAYTAPECFYDCRYCDKSDIYSFGMILAVLLTGRDPSDPFFREAPAAGSAGSMACWLRHLQQAGDAREALDKSILGEEGEEHEMLMAVRIAAACLSDLPADRPSSDELVHMLTQLHSF